VLIVAPLSMSHSASATEHSSPSPSRHSPRSHSPDTVHTPRRYSLRSASAKKRKEKEQQGRGEEEKGTEASSYSGEADTSASASPTPIAASTRRRSRRKEVVEPEAEPESPTEGLSSSDSSMLHPPSATTQLKKHLTHHPFPLSLPPFLSLWWIVVSLHRWWRWYLNTLDTWPVTSKSLTSGVVSIISEALAQWLSGDILKRGYTDWRSVLVQFIIGVLWRGLPLHYWYLCLSWMFRNVDGSRQRARDALKEDDVDEVEMVETTPSTPASVPSSATSRNGSGAGAGPAASGSHAVGGSAPVVKKPTAVGGEPLWVSASKVVVDQLTFSPLSLYLYFYIIGWFDGLSLQSIYAKIAREFWPVMVMNWRIWPLVNLFNFKLVPPSLQVLFGNILAVPWTAYIVLATR